MRTNSANPFSDTFPFGLVEGGYGDIFTHHHRYGNYWNEYTAHLIGPNFMYAKVSNTSLYPLSQVDHEVVILRISFT